MRLSHPHPHPEAPRSGLEGDLQSPRGWLEGSFEARLRLAPQDEGLGGEASSPKNLHQHRKFDWERV